MSSTDSIELVDMHPPHADLAEETLRGLSGEQKTLPCKLFYDKRGSELFEAICELPEYYLTRTEISILRRFMDEITRALGPRVQLIEPGSGAGTKTRLLLDALEDPVSYVPLDISKEHLRAVAESIHRDYPDLQVQPVCADFVQPIHVPDPARPPERRVVFFPGSTIGNFHPEEARAFLDHLADLAGPGGGLLIGFDRRKSPEILVAAYDDSAGLTAEFNLNLLRRLNLDLGTVFPLEGFAHEARWNEQHGRIEMHLVSKADQTVRLGETDVQFHAGESIRTECCHKYGPEGVADLADRFELIHTWTDDEDRFGIQYLTVR